MLVPLPLPRRSLTHSLFSCAETREDRVHDWRNFNKKRKTKKKGPQVLG